MQNLQIYLYPKQLHFSTQSSMNIRLTYKKICITTNHELQKYENRQSYPVRNTVAVINDEIKFKLSKQFQLKNTKIVIIIIGVKGRDISCVGDITLDLTRLRQSSSKVNEVFKAKIDKCKDAKAYLLFEIKFLEKPIDVNELKRSRKEKQKMPELGILKTEYYYKQQLYLSRREKQDKPTAYQISRRNFKQVEIKRNHSKSKSHQQRDSKDSFKDNRSNGSYKKRFLYDVTKSKISESSRNKSIAREIGSNYLKVYQKDKSPSPRTKTPQPIKLQGPKGRETKDRSQTTIIQHLNYYDYDHSKTQQNQRPTQFIEPDTFRIQTNKYQNSNNDSQIEKNLQSSNISQHSLPSISNDKDSKFKMISQKLEIIQNKIRKQKDKFGENSNGKRSPQNVDKLSKSQIEQMESYEIGAKYQPKINTERQYYTEQNRQSPYQKTQVLNQRNDQLSVSPGESTCPRNQKPPSPIEASETPQVIKKGKQEIKMSQFSVNSKGYESALHQQSSPMSDSQMQSSTRPYNNKSFNSFIGPESKFTKITGPQIKKPNSVKQQSEKILQSKILRKSPQIQSKSPQYSQQSPLFLGIQRRQSQSKQQKRSSMGRNYLQTQLKMQQLQIQERDMKYEKLEKKYNKKVQECDFLFKERQKDKQKIINLSNQIIELRQKALQMQRKQEKTEEFQQLNIKNINLLKEKDSQINKLNFEVNSFHDQINILNLQIETFNSQIKRNTIDRQKMQRDFGNRLEASTRQTLQRVPLQDQEHQKLRKEVEQSQIIIQNLSDEILNYQQKITEVKKRYEDLQSKYQKNVKSLQKLQEQSSKASQQSSRIRENEDRLNAQLSSFKEQSLKRQAFVAKFKQESQRFKQKELKFKQESSRYKQQSSRFKEQSLKQKEQSMRLKQQLSKFQPSQRQKVINNSKNSTSQQQIGKNPSIQQIHSHSASQLLQQTIEKQTILQQTLKKLEIENRKLAEDLQKKNKIIEKLNLVNQTYNSKIFSAEEKYEHKILQMEEQIDDLLLKGVQNQREIKDLQTRVQSKEREKNILKQALRDRQNEDQQPKQPKLVRQLQVVRQSQQSPQRSERERSSVLNVTEQGKQNFYDNFMSEKAKSMNLQAQLRVAQNKLRVLSQQIESLGSQNKQMGNEIEKLKSNKKKQQSPARQQKGAFEYQLTAESVKLENKALKGQIKKLQTQVKDLNLVLDSAIQQRSNINEGLQISISAKQKLANERIAVLIQKLKVYEAQLRLNKVRMAEVINVVWKGGNAEIIDQIDKIMQASS